MSLSIVLACLWAVAATVVALLPYKMQFPPGIFLLFAAPVLIVNSEHLNFVDSPGDFELLLERIHAMRGAREFFNLGG